MKMFKKCSNWSTVCEFQAKTFCTPLQFAATSMRLLTAPQLSSSLYLAVTNIWLLAALRYHLLDSCHKHVAVKNPTAFIILIFSCHKHVAVTSPSDFIFLIAVTNIRRLTAPQLLSLAVTNMRLLTMTAA